MYKLNVMYSAKSKEDIHKFYEEVSKAGIVQATRSEEGCIRYDYFFSAERENEILLVENWKNQEAQKHHDTLPHLETLGKIKEKYGIETGFEKV